MLLSQQEAAKERWAAAATRPAACQLALPLTALFAVVTAFLPLSAFWSWTERLSVAGGVPKWCQHVSSQRS